MDEQVTLFRTRTVSYIKTVGKCVTFFRAVFGVARIEIVQWTWVGEGGMHCCGGRHQFSITVCAQQCAFRIGAYRISLYCKVLHDTVSPACTALMNEPQVRQGRFNSYSRQNEDCRRVRGCGIVRIHASTVQHHTF